MAGWKRKTPSPGLQKAIRHFGSVANVATFLGTSRQAIYQFGEIPVKQVGRLAREMGCSKHDLRPDLFDPPGERAPTASTATPAKVGWPW